MRTDISYKALPFHATWNFSEGLYTVLPWYFWLVLKLTIASWICHYVAGLLLMATLSTLMDYLGNKSWNIGFCWHLQDPVQKKNYAKYLCRFWQACVCCNKFRVTLEMFSSLLDTTCKWSANPILWRKMWTFQIVKLKSFKSHTARLASFDLPYIIWLSILHIEFVWLDERQYLFCLDA